MNVNMKEKSDAEPAVQVSLVTPTNKGSMRIDAARKDEFKPF
jgi:hypothetical protein